MSAKTESARIYDAVPQLGRLHHVLLDAWKQPELSRRDRILVTCSILAAMGHQDNLKAWMERGIEGGLTLDEFRGLIAQVAFYAGWPAGLCAGEAALDLFDAAA